METGKENLVLKEQSSGLETIILGVSFVLISPGLVYVFMAGFVRYKIFKENDKDMKETLKNLRVRKYVKKYKSEINKLTKDYRNEIKQASKIKKNSSRRREIERIVEDYDDKFINIINEISTSIQDSEGLKMFGQYKSRGEIEKDINKFLEKFISTKKFYIKDIIKEKDLNFIDINSKGNKVVYKYSGINENKQLASLDKNLIDKEKEPEFEKVLSKVDPEITIPLIVSHEPNNITDVNLCLFTEASTEKNIIVNHTEQPLSPVDGKPMVSASEKDFEISKEDIEGMNIIGKCNDCKTIHRSEAQFAKEISDQKINCVICGSKMKTYNSDRNYIEESDLVTGLSATAILIEMIGSIGAVSLWLGVISWIAGKIVKTSGKREVKEQFSSEFRQVKNEMERLREKYAEKIKNSRDRQEKHRIADKFEKEFTKLITDLIEEIDKKHDLGTLKEASKDDIRNKVSEYFASYIKKNKKNIRKMAEKSSYESISNYIDDSDMIDDDSDMVEDDEDFDKSFDNENMTNESSIIDSGVIKYNVLSSLSEVESIDVIPSGGEKQVYYLMADYVPAAVFHHENASDNIKEIFDDPNKFRKSLLASFDNSDTGGLTSEKLEEFGAEPITVNIPENKVISQQIDEQKKKIESSFKENEELTFNRMHQSLSLSMVGINKEAFENSDNPLKEKMIEILSANAVRQPEKLVNQAFHESGEEYLKTIMSQANEFYEKDDNTRNEMAKFIENASYQNRYNVSETSVQNRLNSGNHAVLPELIDSENDKDKFLYKDESSVDKKPNSGHTSGELGLRKISMLKKRTG